MLSVERLESMGLKVVRNEQGVPVMKRQGDVLLIQVESLPENAQPVRGCAIVKRGEGANHAHRVADIDVAPIYSLEGLLFIKVGQPVKVLDPIIETHLQLTGLTPEQTDALSAMDVDVRPIGDGLGLIATKRVIERGMGVEVQHVEVDAGDTVVGAGEHKPLVLAPETVWVNIEQFDYDPFAQIRRQVVD